jgi:hypothetical protein
MIASATGSCLPCSWTKPRTKVWGAGISLGSGGGGAGGAGGGSFSFVSKA